jgi:hypothetical protein
MTSEEVLPSNFGYRSVPLPHKEHPMRCATGGALPRLLSNDLSLKVTVSSFTGATVRGPLLEMRRHRWSVCCHKRGSSEKQASSFLAKAMSVPIT